MRRTLSLLMLFSLLLSACAGAASPAPQEEPTPTAQPAAARTTYSVERGDILLEARLYGRIAPLSEHLVGFPADGVVRNVYVKAGERVTAGQKLGDLRVDDLEQQLKEAQAQAAQEALAEGNRVRRAEIALETAQLTLEQYKAEKRPATEVRIQELQVELAQMDLDEVKGSLQESPAAVQAAEIQAQIDAAAAFAPVDGTVLSAVNPGRTVRAATNAFVIGDISRLEPSVSAETAVIEQLNEGLPVEVTFDDKPGEPLRGRIRQLPYPYGSGESGGDPTVRIELDDSPEAGGYALGDKVTVRAIVDQRQGVLRLPANAVRNIGGRTFVMLQDGAGLRRQEVKIGLQTADLVEIQSGLSEGQVVVGP